MSYPPQGLGVNVSDADAAVGDVKSGKTFYAVASPKKTGTMPTKAIVAGSDLYEEGYHAGDPGGLDAIDTDLAPAKIKKDVVIFGKTGTYTPTLAEDVLGSQISGLTTGYADGGTQHQPLAAGADLDLASKTQTYATTSRAVAVGFINVKASFANTIKLRLYMDGVLVTESAYFSTSATTYITASTRALSGSKTCKITIHNYAGAEKWCNIGSASGAGGSKLAAGIGVGSIKV